MIRTILAMAGLSAAAITGCAPVAQPPDVARFAEARLDGQSRDIPEGADPDACYGRDSTPATVETVTRRVLVQPAETGPDGSVIRPAVYRSETRQEIVKEREDIWFETPCPDEMTAEFIAALQRALAVRGHYAGEITGEADAGTARAVRAFQLEQGLNSPVLSIAAAKRLGLVAYDREEWVQEGQTAAASAE
jgi:hypothetical protein